MLGDPPSATFEAAFDIFAFFAAFMGGGAPPDSPASLAALLGSALFPRNGTFAPSPSAAVM
eukprot:2914108-Pyramimonas_sp.AAC.1